MEQTFFRRFFRFCGSGLIRTGSAAYLCSGFRVSLAFAALLLFCHTGLSAISVGGRVRVTQNAVNVRASAGSTTVNGQQNTGALGTVTSGPTNAQIGGTGTTYTWWNVNFDSGADGWVAQDFLAEVVTTTVDVQPLNVTRGSSSVVAGGSLSVSWQIRNNGTGTAGTSNSQVRITTSNASNGYGNSTNNVGSPQATGSIAAGATINQNTTVTVPTTPSTYYVWISADNNTALVQSNTSNDFAVSASFTVTAPTTVDVEPLNVTRGSGSVLAGGSLSVSWQIRNNGSGTAGTSNSQVRITTSNASNGYGNSTNNVGSPQATGAIAAGATINQNTTVTVPTTPGTYYVWISADNNTALAQSNTSNDFAVSASFTVTAPTTVDVEPLNVTRGSGSVLAGGSLSVSWQIRNNGSGTAGTSNSQVRITTSNASNGYGNSTNNVGSPQATGSITAGATINQNTTVTVPTTPGTYYMWISADNNTALVQSNTSNDFAVSASFAVTAPTTVDVEPLNVTRGSSSVVAGGSLSVSWQIRNNGTGTAGTSNSQVRITTSNASNGYGNSTNNVGSPQATGSIGGGATINQNTTVTVPTTPGTYYVWISADNNTALVQSNTSNDFAVSASFAVTAPTTVDVEPLNVTRSSGSVVAGGSLSSSWQIRNNGTGTAGTSNSQVRITTSNASNGYGNSTNNVGSAQATGTIAAGATINQNTTVTVPSTPGTYYVWISADNNTALVQSNTSNDFAVSASFTVTATPGQPGNFTLTNQTPYWDSNAPAGPAVRLNWTPSTGAANYDVYRNGSLYASNLAGTTYLNNLNLTGGQTYSYYIVAKNGAQTRQSNTVQVLMPTAPQTPIPTLTGVTVTGPSNVAPGSSTPYSATAQFSSGPTQDVTASAQWNVSGGPSGTQMIGSTLIAGSGSASTATVTAAYGNNTGTKVGNKSVAVGSGFSVEISSPVASYVSGSGTNLNYDLRATAIHSGGTGMVTASWMLDNTSYGAGSPLVLHASASGAPGSHMLKVTVTDGAGRAAQATTDVFFPKAPQGNEQYPKVGTNLAHPPKLFAPDATSDYSPTRDASKGLVVIIHGMDGRVTTDTTDENDWMKRMADAISAKLLTDAPNIILYDWHRDTDVLTSTSAVSAAALKAFADEVLPRNASFGRKLRGVAESIGAGAAVSGIGLGAGTVVAVNLLALRPVGEPHGFALADYIRAEILAGRVSPTAPIHLIGHSAGGFVASTCGLALLNDATLRASGKLPTDLQVTTLDTPFLRFTYIQLVRSKGGKFERYVSSPLGTLAPGVALINSYDALESALSSVRGFFSSIASFFTGNRPAPGFEESVSYHVGEDRDATGWTPSRHIHAHEWYTETIKRPDSYSEGFYYSPFPGGHPFPGGGMAAAGFTADGESPMTFSGLVAAAPLPLAGFSTFGTVSESAGAYTLTEQGNAGIYKSVTLPANASTLKFRVQFTQPGDGDFIEVTFGDHPSLTVIADAPIVRAGMVEFEVPIVMYGGETDQLLFKLNGVGADNAVAVLDSITVTTDDDADGDGLSFDQEIAIGTDPRFHDTDVDGWDDAYEINVSGTSPVLWDTDGDGVSDFFEAMAGTNATDSGSVFVTKQVSRATDGSVTIAWSAKAGKTYRILRSTTPDFTSFDIIASKINGVESLTNYTDSGSNLQGVPAAFYRVEVE